MTKNEVLFEIISEPSLLRRSSRLSCAFEISDGLLTFTDSLDGTRSS
jgi:hypothetical protein